ncbi:alpha/beta hydrolase [Actinoplanes friuliensis]|uniref:Alpha/beta hydrolase fold protein n=1 Tax=Actinoplanes friuliensis DSM 7358 TaxID=1246995 RepID=U5W3T4_9ACTN|nr:alpha/beta hydrolase [Actinoplanes friuliensis]AGZ42640.1 alpha/beta hydrolase fold protein [Actinoplanes friuliensis DSM 7358]
MPAFTAPDGTLLAYHVKGVGEPLICLPGGPMQDSAYLRGLPLDRQLILLDPRGTGGSAVPSDPASYRCDRQVGDVEALRRHLGLERFDLLAHSAGTNLAVLYVQEHAARVDRLALITPSLFGVGIPVSGNDRREVALLRRDEPWFGVAFAALEKVMAGKEADFAEVEPFRHGRWDDAARARVASDERHRNDEAAGIFASEGAFDAEVTRVAVGGFAGSVLVVAGEYDLNSPPGAVGALAALFPKVELVVQPAAGHFPWLDDADRFSAAAAGFFASSVGQAP